MSQATALEVSEVRTAAGDDLDRLLAALGRSRSVAGPVVTFDAGGFGPVRAGQVFREAFSPDDDPALRILGSHGQLLEGVLRPVRRPARRIERERLGLYVALGMVDSPIEDLLPAIRASRDATGRFDLARFFAAGYRSVHPLWPLSMLNNVAVGQIATDLDVRGDNLVLASEADAGIRVLLEAHHALLEGAADGALVAAASERIGPASLARRRLRGLPLGEDGTTAPGEGAAACLLVQEDHADLPHARLLGGATGFGPSEERPGPTADALRRVLEAALASTGLRGDAIHVAWLDLGGVPDQARDERGAVADVLGPHVQIQAPARLFGHAGPAAPLLSVALAARQTHLAALAGIEDRRRALCLGTSSTGALGAVVLEGWA